MHLANWIISSCPSSPYFPNPATIPESRTFGKLATNGSETLGCRWSDQGDISLWHIFSLFKFLPHFSSEPYIIRTLSLSSTRETDAKHLFKVSHFLELFLLFHPSRFYKLTKTDIKTFYISSLLIHSIYFSHLYLADSLTSD